jgi:hypothetical protein
LADSRIFFNFIGFFIAIDFTASFLPVQLAFQEIKNKFRGHLFPDRHFSRFLQHFDEYRE